MVITTVTEKGFYHLKPSTLSTAEIPVLSLAASLKAQIDNPNFCAKHGALGSPKNPFLAIFLPDAIVCERKTSCRPESVSSL
jgi:hypothetical protein